MRACMESVSSRQKPAAGVSVGLPGSAGFKPFASSRQRRAGTGTAARRSCGFGLLSNMNGTRKRVSAIFAPVELAAPPAPAAGSGAAVNHIAAANEKKGIKKLGNAIVHMNRVVNQARRSEAAVARTECNQGKGVLMHVIRH